jgi:hypothetical protein
MNANELHNKNDINRSNTQPSDGKDSDNQKIETGIQEQPKDHSTSSSASPEPQTWAAQPPATPQPSVPPAPMSQPYSSPPPLNAPNTTKSSLIAGFSVGVACFSLLGSWIPIINIFSIIIALVSIILGIIGMFKSNKALSITGLVISVITILVAVGINILFFVVADTSANPEPDANKTEGLYKYNEKQDDFYEST